MTQHHPINPPPKLMQQWAEQFEARGSLLSMFEDIYRAGADAELEACVAWLDGFDREGWAAEQLRAARRPKPSSLKKQALDQLDGIAAVFRVSHGGDLVCDKIRCALEQLPDDQ